MKNGIYIVGILLLLSGCKSIYGDGSNRILMYKINKLGYSYEVEDAETYKVKYVLSSYGSGYKVYH